ncbi:MAG: hybrid sensor histidine kinase/response regulator [Saprospiraceae bacterium]|nr:hybrid sensor histidine kinase/response regulator [Saprospiraceae bacterium]
MPHVFDRYYQTKQPNVAAEGGTGIGLALVKELVNLFEGNVKVESKTGEGTVFTINIPRIETFDTTILPEEEIVETLNYDFDKNESSVNSMTQIHNRKILIVEDNPTLCNFIKLLLNHHQISVAGNGKEALEQLKKEQPDLIISDVMMPIMDGFQLLDALKNSDKYRHIPILMLTARASMSDKLKALRIGVDDYMTKPFEQDELFARVNNLLKTPKNARNGLKKLNQNWK